MVRRGLALTGRQATKLLSVFPGFVIVEESFICPSDVTFFIVRRPACVGARIHLVPPIAGILYHGTCCCCIIPLRIGHPSMDPDLGERDTPQSLNKWRRGGGRAGEFGSDITLTTVSLLSPEE